MPRANRAFISPPNSMASVISETKLVETEHVGFRFKAVGDDLQRVAMSLQGGQLFVYAQHETMEMQALFTLARQALVKQVHQPGFASPHAAPYTGRGQVPSRQPARAYPAVCRISRANRRLTRPARAASAVPGKWYQGGSPLLAGRRRVDGCPLSGLKGNAMLETGFA